MAAREGRLDRKLPVSNRLCPDCGTLLAQALVDAGETWHVTCGPNRRPMTGGAA